MTVDRWKQAERTVQRVVRDAQPERAQLDLLILAERAMVEASVRASYRKPDGSLHFDNLPGPLCDGLAFVIGALTREAGGFDASEQRLLAATKLFEAGWALMLPGRDPEPFRAAAVAAMPILDEDGDPI